MLGKKNTIHRLSSQMQSIIEPKNNQLIQDHNRHGHLFLLSSYNKVDPRTRIISKNHKLTKTTRGRNSNNKGILITNTSTPNSQNNRIMIVDDEQDIARLFAISLENNGFVVDIFNDPLSALSNYKAGLYDLLLLDIRMPDMNGFELYQKIKDLDDKAKVCFITAYDESLNEFKKLFPSLEDVDCFLKKPIEMHNLVKIVKSKINYN
jgi:CheY-like chemotaxis protein